MKSEWGEEETQALIVFKTPQVIPITAEVKNYYPIGVSQAMVGIRITGKLVKIQRLRV